MADYHRNNRSGGNRNFGKPRFNRERSEMFSATCANCGKQCEVPFRPTGNKPVLCRDCFQNNRNYDSQRSEQRSYDRPQVDRDNNQNRQNYLVQLDEINSKLDKILSMLTPKPLENKPLESEISEEAIEEIVQEMQKEDEDKKIIKKKSKKTSSVKDK